MNKDDLRLYQEAKKSGDTNLLSLHYLTKQGELLKTIAEELKNYHTQEIASIKSFKQQAEEQIAAMKPERGARFIGKFETEDDLPEVDGENVKPGDMAYVEDTGELLFVE